MATLWQVPAAMLPGGQPSTEAPAADDARAPAPQAESFADIAPLLQETLSALWVDLVSHLPFLVAGTILLGLTWIVAALASRVLAKALARSDLRGSLQDLISRLFRMAIWAAGVLVVALVVFPGLTPARAIGGLGLLSIAIGLAFKDIFENFFAGVLLLWRFPFENGDYIECQGIVGQVLNVTVRNTLIRRMSGELVVVPNSTLFKNPVDVLTDRSIRRVTVMAGVAYGEQVPAAKQVIEQAVRSCESVNQDEPVQIFTQAFGASSIDIEVAWWTGARPVEIRRSRDEVVTAIKGALDEAGIEIPFPYRTLVFKEPLALSREQDGAA